MLTITSENRLDEWVRANAREAQGLIVELVWRLVTVSCPQAHERRFPLTDSIGQHGPDGVLETALGFEPFVPDGRSFWEIGTGSRARDKATTDYNDLTAAVPEHIRKETTFVFVTPLSARRDWKYSWKQESQAAWVEERRNRSEWKDVRVIDGTKLIDWTHQFPSVELWLVQKIIPGLSALQTETLEQHWENLRLTGASPLPPEVFLANRTEACVKLREIFDGSIFRLKLTTHFPDQVIDFVAAYAASLEGDDRIHAVSRCLIVRGIEAWHALCNYQQKLTLVAHPDLGLDRETGSRLLQQASRAGHAIIFWRSPGGAPDDESAPLPKPKIYELQQLLKKAGHGEERARRLAQQSSGNLSSLLRLLQGGSPQPVWAASDDAPDLALALLLGAWEETSEADCKAIEDLTAQPYAAWIEKMRRVVFLPSTPLAHHEGQWKFVLRYEGWHALGPRLFDEHLDRFRRVAISVLQEPHPQFELPPDRRFMSSVYGKELKRSPSLREGLAETLALMGSHDKALTSCSQSHAELTAILVVRELLEDADWIRWASLDHLLPLLAEAAPDAFLSAVERAVQHDPCPFDTLFAQESGGPFGRTYTAGLLWALERLAWDANLLSRVALCLGGLAARDPGGTRANRPARSLTAILLPWLPQTCAPLSRRVAAIKSLLAEHPDVGWKLLISLLPKPFLDVATYTSRPAWRETIPDDWQPGVTHQEYWEQVGAYADLAVNEAQNNISKLTELVDYLGTLPQPAFERLVERLHSEHIKASPDEGSLPLWNALAAIVTKHKKFAGSHWAMSGERLDRIAAMTDDLAPQSPSLRYQRLFVEADFDLYEERDDFEEQAKNLEIRRQRAIEEIIADGGVEAVIAFARTVQSPWKVGAACGAVAHSDADSEILPYFLETDESSLIQFAESFVRSRFQHHGWLWVDAINTSQWTPERIGRFLACLPCEEETWTRVERLLGEDQAAYWKNISTNTTYRAKGDLEYVAGQLLHCGRPFAAIFLISSMLYDGQRPDPTTAIRALREALISSESAYATTGYEIGNVITWLQSDPGAHREDLLDMEWAYLPLLDGHSGASPKTLWQQLADDPKFFCELTRLACRSWQTEGQTEEMSEETKIVAKKAASLLFGWSIPPGLRGDRTYDGDALTEWLNVVTAECAKTGYLEIAMEKLGQALMHAPPDPDGLWIHRAAAAVLNGKDADNIRQGFRNALYNSRGVHSEDPMGKPERELAAMYRARADAVEHAGYPRLAHTLRELADAYDREAEAIIRKYDRED